jgi:hypothetical protein
MQCDFNTHTFNYDTHDFDSNRHFSTRRVWFIHAEGDFHMQSVIATLSVCLTRTNVIVTLTNVILTRTKVISTRKVKLSHAA